MRRIRKKDARIKVIHKTNGGLSDARNVGIESATGTYIGFVDGDDFIEPDMYRKLYDALVENNADISICSFRFVGAYEDRNDKIEITDEVLSGREILLEKRMRKNARGWVLAWNKLYKKEIFHTLRYPVGKAHEDDFILQDLFWNVKRVACTAYVGYNYIQRSSSITHAYRVNRLDEIESKIKRDSFYEAKQVSSAVRYKNLLRGYYVLYDVYAHADFKQEPFASRIEELNRELKKRNRILRKNRLSRMQKTVLLANDISPYFTWKAMQFVKKMRGRNNV